MPTSTAQLEEFLSKGSLSTSSLFAPTEQLASEYGVIDEEEIEYAALEIARNAAEDSGRQSIIALELDIDSKSPREISPGILDGDFALMWKDVQAIYLIVEEEQELTWYDASEATLCLKNLGV